MSIIDTILSPFRGPALNGKKSLDPTQAHLNYSPLVPINASAVGAYGTGNYVKAYLTSADLYSVVTFLNRKMASIPWYVYEVNKGADAQKALRRYKDMTRQEMNVQTWMKAQRLRKAAYDENAILDDGEGLGRLMARPNGHQGQDQFMESAFGYHNLSGEANIYGNSGLDPKGEIVEMEVLPTQFVLDYYDPKDLYGILAHALEANGRIPIAKENLMRWKNWTPEFDAQTRVHMRGISIVQVGWKTYMMNIGGAEVAAGMLKNGGSKGALSPIPVGNQVTRLDKPQLDAASASVNARFNGVENINTIGVLAGPYDYLNFGLNAVDLQIIPIMNLTLYQWCRMLGLPTVLFDPEHTSDNNYQNALRDLVTNTVIPKMSSFRDQLNKWLLPRFKAEGKYFIDFDAASLPELQRDIEKLVNSLRMAYWLTEDEKRIEMNREPKGGIYATSLIPSGMTPIEMAGQDLSPQEGDPEDPFDPDNGDDNETDATKRRKKIPY